MIVVVLLLAGALRVGVSVVEGGAPAQCFPHSDLMLHADLASVRQRSDELLTLDLFVFQADARRERVRLCPALNGARVRLSWYRPPFRPGAGDRLRLVARLRAPWGMKNPGTFDYQRWLKSQGFAATGYVKRATLVSAAAREVGWSVDAGMVHRAELRAIGFGDQTGISDRHWELFRRTGTVHLMVVSGLHVAVVAALAFAVAQLSLRLLVVHRGWFLPRHAALAVAAGAVIVFAWRSGLDPPVVRASIAFLLSAACLATLRRIPWWRGLATAACLAVVVQPLVVLQQGFWLSHLAVFCLLAAFVPRWRRTTRVRGLLQAQGVLLVGLSPWIGALIGEIALVGPLANLLVVPLVSLAAIPTAVTGFAIAEVPGLQSAATVLLRVADITLAAAIATLEALQGWMPMLGPPGSWRTALCFGAGMLLLVPLSAGWRALALAGCALLLLPNPARIPYAEFRITVLDVGQGSSTLIDTARHRLVVDAGPAFASGFNTGAAIVLPALLATGPDRVDGFVISHGDIDHAGGLAPLRERFPSAWLIEGSAACEDGRSWIWDGVVFTLYSAASRALSRNDRSCTVHVAGRQESAYLSGDIGVHAERRLINRLPSGVTLLVGPHHGSAGSSGPAFVRHLNPEIVVFSAGKDNRYGHPRPDVLARYARGDARIFVTALHGAIVWQSNVSGSVKSWRRSDT